MEGFGKPNLRSSVLPGVDLEIVADGLNLGPRFSDSDLMEASMLTRRGAVVGLLVFVVIASAATHQDLQILEGPYLGQRSPGIAPEVFAPGVVSTDVVEGCVCFSFDHRYFVFRRGFREDTEIYFMEDRPGGWTEPARAPFFVKEYGFGDFTFSPNRPELYFTSRRPLEPGGEPTESANLWKVGYENGVWREPVQLGESVNSDLHESYPSVSNDGTLFFFRRFDTDNGLSEIMYSTLDGGAYAAPKRMGWEINTKWDEWDPCVSPDGDLLVFCSKKPSGFGEDDLYVSFKKEAGGWTEAINLGAGINSERSENRPFITADGKYLFFNSNVNGSRDVFWVDLEVVLRLKTVPGETS